MEAKSVICKLFDKRSEYITKNGYGPKYMYLGVEEMQEAEQAIRTHNRGVKVSDGEGKMLLMDCLVIPVNKMRFIGVGD